MTKEFKVATRMIVVNVITLAKMKVFLLLLIILCWRCSMARTTYSKNQWDQSNISQESFNAEDFLSRTLVAPSSTLKTKNGSINISPDLDSSPENQDFPLVFRDKVIKIGSTLHSDKNEKSQLKNPEKKFHHVIEFIPKNEFQLPEVVKIGSALHSDKNDKTQLKHPDKKFHHVTEIKPKNKLQVPEVIKIGSTLHSDKNEKSQLMNPEKKFHHVIEIIPKDEFQLPEVVKIGSTLHSDKNEKSQLEHLDKKFHHVTEIISKNEQLPDLIKIGSTLHSDKNEKSQLKNPDKKFHHVIEIIPKDEFQLPEVVKIGSTLHSDKNEKTQLEHPDKKFHHVIEIVPQNELQLTEPKLTDCAKEALQEDYHDDDVQVMLQGPEVVSSKLDESDQNREEMDEANSLVISHLQTESDDEPEIVEHQSFKEDNLQIDSFAGNDETEGSGEERSGLNESGDKSGRFFSIFSRRNETAPTCTTPQNETGHCRPFRHCLLSNALNNYNIFLQYMCLIRGIQVGICCADNPVIETTNPDENETKSDPSPEMKLPPEGCGLNIKTRIVGGSVSVPHEWSWMVALLRKNRFFCGGVLINNLYVLTAAHCVMGVNVRDIKVRLGEYNFNTQTGNEADMSVAEIKRHSQFVTLTFQHDIALLKLRQSVQYSKFVGSICLPANKTRDYSDVKGTVVGWGTVSFGGAASPVLREVTIPIWKNKDCDRTYRLETIDDSFLCAGAPAKGEDACQGDSGGPLMTLNERGRWEVVGIVSWGRRCGDPTYPGVYARVTTYLDWIKQNMV